MKNEVKEIEVTQFVKDRSYLLVFAIAFSVLGILFGIPMIDINVLLTIAFPLVFAGIGAVIGYFFGTVEYLERKVYVIKEKKIIGEYVKEKIYKE
jgi:hypothetical protein